MREGKYSCDNRPAAAYMATITLSLAEHWNHWEKRECCLPQMQYRANCNRKLPYIPGLRHRIPPSGGQMILLKKPPTTVTNRLVGILLQPWFLSLHTPILYFWQTTLETLCPSLSKTEVLRAEPWLKLKELLIAEYHTVLLSASLCNGNSGTDRLSPLETLSCVPVAALWRFDWTWSHLLL